MQIASRLTRLSLNTNCSQEALHLSYVLGYVGNQLLRHARNSTMEYEAKLLTNPCYTIMP
jgi:hypothetical protein